MPSQHALQRLLVPAEGDPAQVLLEAELRTLEAGLRQSGDEETALHKAMRTRAEVDGGLWSPLV